MADKREYGAPKHGPHVCHFGNLVKAPERLRTVTSVRLLVTGSNLSMPTLEMNLLNGSATSQRRSAFCSWDVLSLRR